MRRQCPYCNNLDSNAYGIYCMIAGFDVNGKGPCYGFSCVQKNGHACTEDCKVCGLNKDATVLLSDKGGSASIFTKNPTYVFSSCSPT